MKKALLTGIAALSVLYASAAHAREWQGNMPRPVGKLPSNPPIVCVTPNWIPEPCEGRQSSPKQAHTGNWDFMDGPDWKALWDFLRLLDTSWVATAEKKVQPWTGGWPKHTTVLYLERGGILHEHIKRWLDLAKSGDDVEIRDQCASACTLIMAFVPRERICFGKYSSLLFHAVRNAPDMRIDVSATVWMFNQYPGDIREWLGERGGLAVGDVVASALDLWVLGYRQCAPDPDPNSQEGRERRANDWEEWRKSNEPPDPNEVPIPMTIMKSTKMGVGG